MDKSTVIVIAIAIIVGIGYIFSGISGNNPETLLKLSLFIVIGVVSLGYLVMKINNIATD